MTIRSTLRSLSFLFSEAWYALRSSGSALERVNALADALADAEAMEEVTEPQGDCGLGGGEFVFGMNEYFPLPQVDDPAPAESTIRLPDHDFVFRDWRIDVRGPSDISIIFIAADGTSLRIADVGTALFLHRATGQYLRECGRHQRADEDYAHDLNEWLNTSVAPAPRSADAATERPGAGATAAPGHPTPAETHKQALTRAMDEDRKTTTATTEGI